MTTDGGGVPLGAVSGLGHRCGDGQRQTQHRGEAGDAATLRLRTHTAHMYMYMYMYM